MSKTEPLRTTPGTAVLKEEHFRNPATDEYEYYGRIEADSNRVCVFDEDCDEHIPDLYTDAHNTYNALPVLPSELKRRLEEAVGMLHEAAHYADAVTDSEGADEFAQRARTFLDSLKP